MKLGALPNLSSLTKLPLLWERVWGQRPGVGKISAVPCLGGVLYEGWFLFLGPPRHWQERNRKGRVNISIVVAGCFTGKATGS